VLSLSSVHTHSLRAAAEDDMARAPTSTQFTTLSLRLLVVHPAPQPMKTDAMLKWPTGIAKHHPIRCKADHFVEPLQRHPYPPRLALQHLFPHNADKQVKVCLGCAWRTSRTHLPTQRMQCLGANGCLKRCS
jgi:hypothetical protein